MSDVMVVESNSSATDLADALEAHFNGLLDLWESLTPSGPALRALETENVPAAVLRERYLSPLARLLIGGLRGSRTHAAIYLDERLRYVDPALGHSERARVLQSALLTELTAVSQLVADHLAPDEVTAAFTELHRSLVEPPAEAVRVLFIGDCLFTETRAFLTVAAQESGRPLDIRHIFFSARRPMESRNEAIISSVSEGQPALIALSLFTFEGVPPWTAAWQQAGVPLRGRAALHSVDAFVELVRETVTDIRSVTDAPIAVHTPAGLPLDRFRRHATFFPAHSRTQRRLIAGLKTRLSELTASTENTILVDEPAIVREHGGLRAISNPVFDPAHIGPAYFHTSRLGSLTADYYGELADDLALLGRAKALFVDFDNTLWKGVMGEGSVVHDLDGQRLLRTLKNAGVLLVALSKNDAEAIRWDEMLLEPDDFVLHKINWLPKPENVSAAIYELDLAPDAFVLLDDNPVERALVAEQVPGVRTLDPTTPQAWRALERWLEFPSTKQTEESRRRTLMYRQAAERRAALGGTHDYAAMMRSLNLTYRFRPAESGDMPRLLELIQRTNQFNTTTRRRSQAEIEAMLGGDDHRIYVASLSDRFGDLGIVATVIIDLPERTIDSFIMSCRAMGFGLELAVLHDAMTAQPPGPFAALFVPSERNGPASSLYRDAGFTDAGDGTWTVSEDRASWPQTPDWLEPSR